MTGEDRAHLRDRNVLQPLADESFVDAQLADRDAQQRFVREKRPGEKGASLPL